MSPVVFAAILSDMIWSMPTARRIVKSKHMLNEDERAEAVALMKDYNRKPAAVTLRAWREFEKAMYARHNPEPEVSAGKDSKRFKILKGRFQNVAKTWKNRTFDLCFCDPLWGEPDTCEGIAELWSRVGKPGSLLCLMPGMGRQDEAVVRVRKHLDYVCSGSWRSQNSRRGPGFRIQDSVAGLRRISVQPLWFFAVRGAPPNELLDNEFEARNRLREPPHKDVNQRDLGAMIDVIAAMQIKPGQEVLDMCCCTGTTGVAALLAGARFTGIEVVPERVKLAEARCAQAQREDEGRAAGMLADIVRARSPQPKVDRQRPSRRSRSAKRSKKRS